MTDNTPALLNFPSVVQEFHDAFGAEKSIDLRMRLIEEEFVELIEAFAIDNSIETIESLENILKEACDLTYVIAGTELTLLNSGLGLTKPFLMSMYQPVGEVIKIIGVEKFNEAFMRVHQSNMSKLGDDGQPVRREDGKVLKGPNYKPPVLTDLVLETYLKFTNAKSMETMQ